MREINRYCVAIDEIFLKRFNKSCIQYNNVKKRKEYALPIYGILTCRRRTVIRRHHEGTGNDIVSWNNRFSNSQLNLNHIYYYVYIIYCTLICTAYYIILYRRRRKEFEFVIYYTFSSKHSAVFTAILLLLNTRKQIDRQDLIFIQRSEIHFWNFFTRPIHILRVLTTRFLSCKNKVWLYAQ